MPATTILQAPKTTAPVYNDIVFVLSNTSVALQNFRYVCDIYVSGVTGYTRLKADPDPTYSAGVFKVNRVLENYVTKNIDKTTTGFQLNAASYVAYECKFGYEYGPSSGVTTVLNDSLSGVYWATNMVFDADDRLSYHDQDYFSSPSNVRSLSVIHAQATSGTKDLINVPQTEKIRYADDAWLHFMTSGTVNHMLITARDSSDAIIKTSQISNPFAPQTNYTDRFLRIACGPNNLNNISAALFTVGSQPVVPTNAYSYVFNVIDNFTNAIVPSIRMFIDNECNRYTIYRIHFLNKLGGYDSFNFKKASRINEEINRTNYNKIHGSVKGASSYNYVGADRIKTTYNTEIVRKYTVNSDWLNGNEVDFMEQLISSPDVYYDDGTTLWAINIVSSSFEWKYHINEKLFNYAIEFEMTFNTYRQRF